MEVKHTPGPWRGEDNTWPKINQKGVWWFILAGAEDDAAMVAEICRTVNATEDDVACEAANANLVAAAPELLEALQVVMGWIDGWSPNFTDDPEWPKKASHQKPLSPRPLVKR